MGLEVTEDVKKFSEKKGTMQLEEQEIVGREQFQILRS